MAPNCSLRTPWVFTHAACQIRSTARANHFYRQYVVLGASLVPCCPRHCLRAPPSAAAGAKFPNRKITQIGFDHILARKFCNQQGAKPNGAPGAQFWACQYHPYTFQVQCLQLPHPPQVMPQGGGGGVSAFRHVMLTGRG